jgi:hypothetical protein
MLTRVAALALLRPTPRFTAADGRRQTRRLLPRARCASEDDAHCLACLNYLDGLAERPGLGLGARHTRRDAIHCFPEGVSVPVGCGQLPRSASANLVDLGAAPRISIPAPMCVMPARPLSRSSTTRSPTALPT